MAVLVVAIAAPADQADTWTYSYQGENFNSFYGGYTCPPECSLSGWFTLDAPLGDNLSNANVDPTSFYFTDGAIIWTASDVSSESFSFYTDASGNIIGWYLGAAIGTYPLQIYFDTQGGQAPPAYSVSSVFDTTTICDGPGPCLADAEVFDDPGTWTVTSVPAPVPEPGPLSSLTLGLVGLGLCWWKTRKREARGPLAAT